MSGGGRRNFQIHHLLWNSFHLLQNASFVECRHFLSSSLLLLPKRSTGIFEASAQFISPLYGSSSEVLSQVKWSLRDQKFVLILNNLMISRKIKKMSKLTKNFLKVWKIYHSSSERSKRFSRNLTPTRTTNQHQPWKFQQWAWMFRRSRWSCHC